MSKPKDDSQELRPDVAVSGDYSDPKTPENGENGEYNEAIAQANFSALLYVVTEQQALIGKLLEVLMNNNIISTTQLEAITDIYGDEEILKPVYEDVYKRFAWYFMATKDIIEKNGAVCTHQPGECPKNSPEDPDNV